MFIPFRSRHRNDGQKAKDNLPPAQDMIPEAAAGTSKKRVWAVSLTKMRFTFGRKKKGEEAAPSIAPAGPASPSFKFPSFPSLGRKHPVVGAHQTIAEGVVGDRHGLWLNTKLYETKEPIEKACTFPDRSVDESNGSPDTCPTIAATLKDPSSSSPATKDDSSEPPAPKNEENVDEDLLEAVSVPLPPCSQGESELLDQEPEEPHVACLQTNLAITEQERVLTEIPAADQVPDGDKQGQSDEILHIDDDVPQDVSVVLSPAAPTCIETAVPLEEPSAGVPIASPSGSEDDESTLYSDREEREITHGHSDEDLAGTSIKDDADCSTYEPLLGESPAASSPVEDNQVENSHGDLVIATITPVPSDDEETSPLSCISEEAIRTEPIDLPAASTMDVEVILPVVSSDIVEESGLVTDLASAMDTHLDQTHAVSDVWRMCLTEEDSTISSLEDEHGLPTVFDNSSAARAQTPPIGNGEPETLTEDGYICVPTASTLDKTTSHHDCEPPEEIVVSSHELLHEEQHEALPTSPAAQDNVDDEGKAHQVQEAFVPAFIFEESKSIDGDIYDDEIIVVPRRSISNETPSDIPTPKREQESIVVLKPREQEVNLTEIAGPSMKTGPMRNGQENVKTGNLAQLKVPKIADVEAMFRGADSFCGESHRFQPAIRRPSEPQERSPPPPPPPLRDMRDVYYGPPQLCNFSPTVPERVNPAFKQIPSPLDLLSSHPVAPASAPMHANVAPYYAPRPQEVGHWGYGVPTYDTRPSSPHYPVYPFTRPATPSRLNVHAPVFVPRSRTSTDPHSLNPQAHSFIPRHDSPASSRSATPTGLNPFAPPFVPGQRQFEHARTYYSPGTYM